MEHRTSSAMFSVLVPLLSSLAGLAARAGGASEKPSTLRLTVQRLALPLVIVVLLSTTAWFNAWALRGFTPPVNGDGAGLGQVLTLRRLSARARSAREPLRSRRTGSRCTACTASGS